MSTKLSEQLHNGFQWGLIWAIALLLVVLISGCVVFQAIESIHWGPGTSSDPTGPGTASDPTTGTTNE